MAVTVGVVQQLSIVTPTAACVWIGPKRTNVEVLTVSNDGSVADAAFAANVIQTLAAAACNYRIVRAEHPDSGSKISMVQVEPL
jgi:hypothetical protein